MTNKVPDWDDLTDIWQQSPDVDMDKLARHARFVWWRMRINFVFEVIVCLFGMGLFGWDLLSGAAASQAGGVPLAMVLFLVCALGLWASFYIRAGAWGQADGTAQSLVDLQIRRAKSSIRYVLVNNWGCGVGLVAFGFLYWSLIERYESIDSPQLTLVAGGMLLFLLFPFATIPFLKRKRDQLKRLEALARQLDDDEDKDPEA